MVATKHCAVFTSTDLFNRQLKTQQKPEEAAPLYRWFRFSNWSDLTQPTAPCPAPHGPRQWTRTRRLSIFNHTRKRKRRGAEPRPRSHPEATWEVELPAGGAPSSRRSRDKRTNRYCIPASPGSGTYTRHGYIFSSLAGSLTKSSENGALPVISVTRETESQLLPDVGAIVTCKVSSINSRFAKVHILYVGSTPLKNSFRGTIRKEDVRATEKDKVEIYKSFRPGDIVLAKVISLGDAQSNYLLTTAENELGVVVAHSESGVQMVPISWCEMQCPKTHTKELRKVARVQPEFLQT
ncbi:exosome complex component CSL4 [Tupaia chinensis]|uniref:exosome complex component CSL4 n=1 Tax=Tupaia chinensis TaxID=246437 RepID=UPI0007041B9F|nr:exosome complex component CSL4 [Tupaia chinensis]